jgi:hypothetical protein
MVLWGTICIAKLLTSDNAGPRVLFLESKNGLLLRVFEINPPVITTSVIGEAADEVRQTVLH